MFSISAWKCGRLVGKSGGGDGGELEEVDEGGNAHVHRSGNQQGELVRGTLQPGGSHRQPDHVVPGSHRDTQLQIPRSSRGSQRR